MEITFDKETYTAVRKAGAKSPVFHEREIYRELEVESRLILPEDYPLIKDVVKRESLWQFIGCRRIHRAIESLEKIAAGDAKGLKIRTLPMLLEAAREAIGKTAHRYVFVQNELYGTLIPFFVQRINYTPHSQYSEAHTTITLAALHRGSKDDKSIGSESKTFHKKDLCGDTVEKILEKNGIYLESPELLEEYKADLKRYEVISAATGEQYLAGGQAAKEGESRWHKDGVNLLREGEPTKVVIDDRE